MGRYIQDDAPQFYVSNTPLGGITSVFRSGTDYKAVGEVLLRASYSALSALFPRNGSYSAKTNATGMGSGTTNNWQGVTYGNGIFVAVSNKEGVATSVDGVTWVLRQTGLAGNWKSITFGGGLFVAVAQSATSGGALGANTRCMTSPDGVIWTLRTLPSAIWQAITYGGGIFVAVGDTTSAASSPDGITWTARTLPTSVQWAEVAYGNGVFVATSASNASATSVNGTAWTARTMPGTAYTALVYGSSVFVAFNGTGAITSPDGITWTAQANGYPAVHALTYGNGVFVGANYGTGKVYTSPDGLAATWIERPSVGTVGAAIAFGAGTFALIGNASTSEQSATVYVENTTNSDYLYLSGTPGNFVRVQ